MLGISGLGFSGYYDPYSTGFQSRRVQQNTAAQQTQQNTAAHSSGGVIGIPAAQTGTPVLPVQQVKAPPTVELDQADMLGRLENDPAAGAARGRIQYLGGREGAVPGPGQTAVQSPAGFDEAQGVPGTTLTAQLPGAYDPQVAVGDMKLPGARDDTPGVDLPGAVSTPYDDQFPAEQKKPEGIDLPGSKSAQQVAEEGECQTCKNRKYVDGSDDPGVSFKTPTRVSPENAASAVRGHEMEHVTRNQAEARREGREVVSQSVTYHTAICPECGRVYISGGTTQTTTASSGDQSNSGVAAVAGAGESGKTEE